MKKITDIFPEEWLHMDGFDEEYAQKWFEGFMANREIKNLSELKDYIIYLEDVKLCYKDTMKSIETINPKPTDTIVLRFGDIKADEMQHCFDNVQKKFPNNAVVALPSPVELEVASKELWEDYIRMIYETVRAMP